MKDNPVFKIIDIIRGTTVDGPGFRTSIYLSGCNHNCPECHNPESHNPETGRSMTLQEIMEIVKEEDFNVSLSGGDPLYDPVNIKKLVKAIKNDRRNLWIYTGFTWEEIISNNLLKEAIAECDVIVDGRFIKEFRDPDLRFRGSSNQRIIDVARSLSANKIIQLYED